MTTCDWYHSFKSTRVLQEVKSSDADDDLKSGDVEFMKVDQSEKLQKQEQLSFVSPSNIIINQENQDIGNKIKRKKEKEKFTQTSTPSCS